MENQDQHQKEQEDFSPAIRVAKIKEDIEKCKESIKTLQIEYNKLEEQVMPSNQKIFDDEINELNKLIKNPQYEYDVQEKQEIVNNLNFFSEEYKSIIKEIQDALKVIKNQS